MSFTKGTGLFTATALAIIVGPFAQAQDPGWYIGANVGQARAKIDDPGIIKGLQSAGFTGVTLSDDNSSTGFKLFGGYQVNRWFSVEGGYFNLGKFGFTGTTVPPGTLAAEAKFQGLNLDAVFSIPMSERFSLFVRGGAIYSQAKDTFTGTGLVNVIEPSPSKSALKYDFGGGLQYQFTPRVGMRLEAQRYRVDDAVGNQGDLDLVSVGLLLRFGRHKEVAVPVVVTPVPVPPAPTPPPEPVVVMVPVAAATQQYCTILDLQFAIDRDDITREDLEKLAVIGKFMTKYPTTTAVIEGHSDDVGTDEHNLELSKSRAEAVVAYLVDTLKINPARLSAVGYGEARPIADNATEEGKRRNRRINAVIACVDDVEGLTVAPARLTMALVIDFDVEKAVINPEYFPQLRKVGAFLKANPRVAATVEGHSANTAGSPGKALEISKLRAERVVDYLVNELGIDRSRLSSQGYGNDRRFAYNTSAEGQEANRRVNIIITYPK